jgi:hypothetical protein
MKQLLRPFLPLMVMLVVAFGQVALPNVAFACGGGTNSPKDLVLQGVGESGVSCNSNGFTNLLSTIVTILSIVAGGIAVIMIVVSALRFITSGGDSNKVSSAKSALIYALIGVAIAALAQFLVHFVLYQSNKTL